MAKKKVKLKRKAKLTLFIFICLVVSIVFGIKKYQEYKYQQTYEYKFLKKNYTLEEFNIIKSKLNNEQLNTLLLKEYNKYYDDIIKEPYFIYVNLDRYTDYLSKKESLSIDKIVALVNVNRDFDFYENILKTNTSLGKLMLINKYHHLDKSYKDENIVKISNSFSYANNSLTKEAYDAFKNLFEAAKKEGHTIVINSSYRNYESQESLWNARKNLYGTKKADAYAARAGHSEHQSGYAIDVSDFYDKNDDFGKTKAFEWMMKNSQIYGFILRYPENKEDITGYSYEPWHYRYVGPETAKIIYNKNITFDEYYAFYINNKTV